MIILVRKHPKICGIFCKRISFKVLEHLQEIPFEYRVSINLPDGSKYRILEVQNKEDLKSPLILYYLKHL